MSTVSWHEGNCRKADVTLVDNIPACMSCGSIYTTRDCHRSEPIVIRPSVRYVASSHLNWPYTIAFAAPDDVDSSIQASLKRCGRLPFEPRTLPIVQDTEEYLEPSNDASMTVQKLHKQAEALRHKAGDVAMKEKYSHGPVKVETLTEQSESQYAVQSPSCNVIYKTLIGQAEFRILRLSPATSGDNQVIHGTLLHFRLSDRPTFAALSYTWADLSGDRTLCETIFVGTDWIPLPITANCAAALRCLRSRTDARFVWVDAICINQGHIEERSQQVGLMRDIYSRARRVIMFLGDDGPHQTIEGGLMHCLSEKYLYEAEKVQIKWSSQRDWEELRALFKRPYWKRMWVIQEVLLAKEAIVVLNGNSVPLRILKERMLSHDKQHLLPPWAQLTGPSVDGDLHAFSEMLITTSSCQALDDRDRIFALLGLVQGAHLEGLVADFTKTVEEIYTGIAVYFVIRHGQTEILKWATLSSGSFSWVPMWKPLPRDSTDVRHFFLPSNIQTRSHAASEHSKIRDFNHPTHISPTHPCRASRFKYEGIREILNALQPRVLQETGALLLRAYPVVHLGADMNFAFKKSRSDKILLRSSSFSLSSSRKKDAPKCVPRWTIEASRLGIGAVKKLEVFDCYYDWIIEVPNCDVFLHLKPQGRTPGLYRIASVCNLMLFSELDIRPLISMKGREDQTFEDYMLLLRLVFFDTNELILLQSLELQVPADGNRSSSLGEHEGTRAQLSSLELMQYSRWIEFLKVDPESSLGPTSAEASISDFDPSLKAVSSYLDRWSDTAVWDNIAKTSKSINWFQYVDRLGKLRRDILLDLTAPVLCPLQPCHSITLNTSFCSRNDMCIVLQERVGQVLRGFLNDLNTEIETASQPGLSQETLRLNAFEVSETVEWLCTVFYHTAEQVEAEQGAIFSEWTDLELSIRHWPWSGTEYEAIRAKLTQRQVLRILFSRSDLREFLLI